MAGLKVGVGGAWNDAKPFIGVGGAWKKLLFGYVGVGGVWKQFFAAFSASVVTESWFLYDTGRTDPFTGDPVYDGWIGAGSVSVSNGSGSYAYSWTVVSGSATFSTSPTNFSACDFRSPDGSASTVACQVTDLVTGLVTVAMGVITA